MLIAQLLSFFFQSWPVPWWDHWEAKKAKIWGKKWLGVGCGWGKELYYSWIFIIIGVEILRCNLQDHKDIAAEVQESTGFFYRVKAKPTSLKFSATHPSVAPSRPPPPTNVAPQSSKARTGSSSEARGSRGLGNLFHYHKNQGKKGFV